MQLQHTTQLSIYTEHLSLQTSSVHGLGGEESEDDGTDCFGAANEKSDGSVTAEIESEARRRVVNH